MKVINLPFSKKNKILKSTKEGFLLMMPFSPQSENHLGTMHGSASFALAEITSGYFLNQNFADIADQTIPILRSSNIKYKKGTTSSLYSKARLKNLDNSDILILLQFKRKALFTIEVKLFDENSYLVASAEFEWFVSMK